MDEVLDTDALLEQACAEAARRHPGGKEGMRRDLVLRMQSIIWLGILARPVLWTALEQPQPTREYLSEVLDAHLDYVRSGKCNLKPMFTPVPYELREPRTLHLRKLVAGWTGHDLPTSIVQAAREVLHAEGYDPPQGWDDLNEVQEIGIARFLRQVWPDEQSNI